ncbi:MBOAT family O-acyltransferase [Azospirillum doebereinerae]|uniref:MBOAT family O-acyltransferase n=1 Tax=Azospirillum doebereinerae TaxID=92933 RepID=UPI001EE60DD0|nr:MBOAT family protein [Azospirillum doebereinerae]MCG5240335.1 MBOAT family protein [Azospirillum doebereinerae]
MLFPTAEFAIFFLIVFTVGWLLRGHWTAHKLFLAVASVFFYGIWEIRFVPLLVGMALVNHVMGAMIGRAEGRRKDIWLRVAVVANLAVLCLFKYYDFFAESVADLLAALGIPAAPPLLGVALPVGISFFTFHCLSYVIDIHRGRVASADSFIDLLLYIALFPHLVAGPIIRAAYFLPQLKAPVHKERLRTTWALTLIAMGFIKKVVVAGVIGTTLVDPVFADPAAFSRGDLVLAAYGYAVQIYGDFSGYTDMAIGIAALLGFRFPNNFDRPYRAASLREFWHRWHISLSRWLWDYLYTPMGGSRNGRLGTLRNLMLTMLLGGLWHGANWTFVLWGLLHGVGLALERVLDHRPGSTSLPGLLLSRILTFHVVCLGWILFRSPTLEAAESFILALWDPVEGPARQATPYTLALIAMVLLGQQLPADAWLPRFVRRLERWPGAVVGAMFAISIYVIDLLGPEGMAPFIYFQF